MKKIELKIPGLPEEATIHIVGSTIRWGLGLEYPNPDGEGRAALEFDPDTVGVDFKHFVLCDISSRPAVYSAVKKAGYEVTGTGDRWENRWRIWFILPGWPIFGEGVYKNNTFIE